MHDMTDSFVIYKVNIVEILKKANNFVETVKLVLVQISCKAVIF